MDAAILTGAEKDGNVTLRGTVTQLINVLTELTVAVINH